MLVVFDHELSLLKKPSIETIAKRRNVPCEHALSNSTQDLVPLKIV